MNTAWNWLLKRGAEGIRVSAFVFICLWVGAGGGGASKVTVGSWKGKDLMNRLLGTREEEISW